MILIKTLSYLTSQKLKDAEALLKNGRNCGCVNLAGYAIEYSLKRKICSTLNFIHGFPDQKVEFNRYVAALTTPLYTLPVTKLAEIRNHDLNKLLFYSGSEFHIKAGFLDNWTKISAWNPEDRYKISRCSSDKAKEFLHSAKIIIRELV